MIIKLKYIDSTQIIFSYYKDSIFFFYGCLKNYINTFFLHEYFLQQKYFNYLLILRNRKTMNFPTRVNIFYAWKEEQNTKR